MVENNWLVERLAYSVEIYPLGIYKNGMPDIELDLAKLVVAIHILARHRGLNAQEIKRILVKKLGNQWRAEKISVSKLPTLHEAMKKVGITDEWYNNERSMYLWRHTNSFPIERFEFQIMLILEDSKSEENKYKN